MEAVILLGAPGAGKGTAANSIISSFSYTHFSTGDILREAIKSGDPVGREAAAYMEKGELVPDEVIMKLVKARLLEGSDDEKYLFDGFPRTEEQARQLDEVLETLHARLTRVVLLDASPEVLIHRIANRLICKGCGAVYHRTNIKPKVEGICDDCGAELYQRPDDNEQTVRNRLEVFKSQTASLVEYYESKGLLVRIPANGSPSETDEKLLPVFQEDKA